MGRKGPSSTPSAGTLHSGRGLFKAKGQFQTTPKTEVSMPRFPLGMHPGPSPRLYAGAGVSDALGSGKPAGEG